MAEPRIHFVTPTYRPVGGVVKIFDYVLHARSLGFAARVYCADAIDPASALFEVPRFGELHYDSGVEFTRDLRIGLGPADRAFISLPAHYPRVIQGLSPHMSVERIIHIIQNVRHINPDWNDGFAARLLTRPMARIMTNDIVMQAVQPLLNDSSYSTVNPLGHELDYFYRVRSGKLSRPIRVGYTTWKSDLGDHVANQLAGSGFEFKAIREYVGWAELRELYHWSDVFLCCPNPEEGLYMPGLEAMAAGCLVISPDVSGNRAYCRFGENCVEADYESPSSYVAALEALRSSPSARIDELRGAAYEILPRFNLDGERHAFAEFLAQLDERVTAHELSRN